MQRKPTEIHLNNAEHVVIYVDGRVAGECVLGHWDGAADLMERIRHARRLEAVPRWFGGLLDRFRTIVNIEDHINHSPAAKQQAFARGLMDGMAKKTVPHPSGPGVPALPPESTHAYRAGYEYGEAVAAVAGMVAEAAVSGGAKE